MEEEKRKARVIVGVPMERTVPEASFWSFITLAQKGYAFVARPYDRIDVTRNRMAQHLLDTHEFTHLLMLDLDHLHPQDIVERLARWWLKDPTKLVVAGLNFRRTEPYDPLVWFIGPDGGWYHASEWPQGILRCDIVGTGAMLIHRSVFEKIPKPWFTNDYSKVNESDVWPGEDVGFCQKCNEAGIELWCDTTTTSPHLGTNAIDQETYRAYVAAYPALAMSEIDWMREQCGWLWGDGIASPEARGTEIASPEARGTEIASPEARGTRSVLYVGANTLRAMYARELKAAGNQLDLLEIWPANCDHYRGNGLFGDVIQGDVRNFYTTMHWDTAVWLHGPEHVKREELGQALENLETVADHVVIMTPYGYMEQGRFRGNPHEVHVSAWGPQDFTAMGYEAATRGRANEAHATLLAWKRKKE